MRTAIIQTDSPVPNNYHKASFMNSYFLRWQASGYTQERSNFSFEYENLSFEPMSSLQNEIHLTERSKKNKKADLKRLQFLHSEMYALYIKYNFGSEFIAIICCFLLRCTWII